MRAAEQSHDDAPLSGRLFGGLGGVGAWRNATGTMRLKKKQTPGLQKSGRSSVIYWPIYTYFSPAGSWLSFSKRLRIRVRRRDNRRICLFALDGAKSWRYRFISRRTAWRAASTAVASAAEVGAMPHWRAGTGIWCRGWRRAARYSRCKSCWVTSTYSRVMLAL